MPPLKNKNAFANAIMEIIKKRGIMNYPKYILKKTTSKADSAAPDRHTYYLEGPDAPKSNDEKMKKDLGLSPYYWTHTWEDGNYVEEKPHKIKKA